MPTEIDKVSANLLTNLKPIDINVKGDLATLEGEVLKGKILENALAQLKARPGFNPAALSIQFGLKW
ncbi:hypothetical protein [Nitrosomonas sp.]|uniref:hypothetical protein n=1 Tax=Nitrosomonas sp. TaxID=42353 RepID=UPI0033057ACA